MTRRRARKELGSLTPIFTGAEGSKGDSGPSGRYGSIVDLDPCGYLVDEVFLPVLYKAPMKKGTERTIYSFLGVRIRSLETYLEPFVSFLLGSQCLT